MKKINKLYIAAAVCSAVAIIGLVVFLLVFGANKGMGGAMLAVCIQAVAAAAILFLTGYIKGKHTFDNRCGDSTVGDKAKEDYFEEIIRYDLSDDD